MTEQTPAPTAPSPGDDLQLTLDPPKPVAVVRPEQAKNVTGNIDPAAQAAIDAQVEQFVSVVTSEDFRSPQFARTASAVATMGDKEVRQSADVSNRMLKRPVAVLRDGGGGGVGKSLVDLRVTVQALDPGAHGLDGRAHKLLGKLPFGRKINSYFDRYKSAQSQIDAILTALRDGQDELRKDNASIEQEKQNLWQAMQALQRYAYMADRVDQQLEARIATIEAADPERAKVLKEDVLFPVRQKHQDILTQLAVSAQGFLALNVIRHNNEELIKGVDRASTTTVAALRTAIIVSQALATQKLVLDQVTAVRTTTSNIIEGTSEMLRAQAGDIHQQAASAAVETEKLQAAFQNIYATLDAIDTYKVQALDTMKVTVTSLQAQMGKAQQYLDRAQGSSGAPTITVSEPGTAGLLTMPPAAQLRIG